MFRVGLFLDEMIKLKSCNLSLCGTWHFDSTEMLLYTVQGHCVLPALEVFYVSIILETCLVFTSDV